MTTNLLATVKASRIFMDHQRKGFFKIGLMPILVLQDLEIRITTNALSAMASEQLTQGLNGVIGNPGAYKVQGLKLSIMHHPASLEAEVVRIRGNKVELHRVAFVGANRARTHFQSARCTWREERLVVESPATFAAAVSQFFSVREINPEIPRENHAN